MGKRQSGASSQAETLLLKTEIETTEEENYH